MPPKLVAIVGKSNSGKTTLITRLLPLFSQSGLKVGSIKHTHHQVELDKPGKDSWKHRSAGSSRVLLITGSNLALFSKVDSDPTLKELAELYFSDLDLVVSEGFKNEDCLKLEIFRSSNNKSPLYLDPNYQIQAVICDSPPKVSIPVFGLDDIQEIYVWICRKLNISY
jgi:molybdopterin-guanine dinucleotide biosynthesis adapter protein